LPLDQELLEKTVPVLLKKEILEGEEWQSHLLQAQSFANLHHCTTSTMGLQILDEFVQD
jgi:hypothetical protein